jgi:hypothetical protein
MVRSGDRSRRSRSYPTRSSSSKSSGNFRGRRYCVARSGRKAAGGSCSGCNATRTLCWKIDSTPAYRQEAAQAFSLLRQRHPAVVGKGYAVLQSGKVHLHGLFAWLAWAFIHITFLSQLSLKISVFLQWGWVFLTGQRGSRLIVNYQQSEPAQTKPPPPVTPNQAAQLARVETTLTK